MKNQTNTTINPHSLQQLTETYEVIENEYVEYRNFKGLTVSGSLFSLTTFKNVVFDSCVFFASRLENCEFVNCKFINCEFQFSSLNYCTFKFTSFDQNSWDFAQVKLNNLDQCWIDNKTLNVLAKDESNEITHSFSIDGWALPFNSLKAA